ncbi:protein of unknown function DUF503 [Thermocrinis albus DSM 14484]|uniref:DUF503 domain-containing protein n=1 Tax=Thermocrinis albus (strain DSM 14484 / JCM 11386 / HI 11/12) TaxID=638303 RepID=D3SP26_THEAH|nr:DUF503 domain-containing protein [Thermocrinis albus]ADC88913.1 protein of unknown function DUF503 [Thermocrinis albus DSM 14484]
MVVGVLMVELFMPENSSLKEKRYYMRSIKDRLRNQFNVSVAEIDHQDKWQRSSIAVVCAGSEYSYVQETLGKVRNFLDRNFPELIMSFKDKYLTPDM